MPVYNFRGTDMFKAFLLYSFTGALAASLAVHIRLQIDQNEYGIRSWIDNTFNISKKENVDRGLWLRLLFAIIITFFVTLIIYHIMYFLIGFGAGMVAPKRPPNYL